MSNIWNVLTRKKVLDSDAVQETPLARVLNTFDLTALGVGSTLGVGVYVLAGQVAKNTAGPAVVISFLIAAIASVFAGLCYAEFGARTPRAGSAYIYSYLCVGEFIAFVIGWNLILEYIIGSASVAKGISTYLDNLLNGSISRTFEDVAPINIPYMSPYFDFLAFTVPIVLAVALAFGMKESSLVNNIFTTLNIGLVLFVIIAGSMNAHLSNWSINPNDVKNGTNVGKGGFFPFGFEGVIRGAATCFYGFVGFDCIATTGEEVKNPKKAIPISIILSLFIIFLSYFGTSTVITLMVPYYEQDPTAPIPYAFQSIHWNVAALIVSIGAIFGLYASLFGAMFPLPRILYAMANDGLIFKFLGKVNERFKTPIMGTLLAGLFTGTMAAVFDLESLVNMMSIGTLLAYTIVAACVTLLRYSVDDKSNYSLITGSSDSEEGYSESPDTAEPINNSDETHLTSTGNDEEVGYMKQILNFGKLRIPNEKSQTVVTVGICIYCVLCFLLGMSAVNLKHQISEGEPLAIIAISVILILVAITILSIATQPVSRKVLSFQVPLVPLIPALSILFNIYLMIMLDIATWIRFVVWMIIGLPIFYFSRRNLSKNQKKKSVTSPSEVHTNNGFYEDNLRTSVKIESENELKSPVVLKLNVESSTDYEILTPSPSSVLENLDLVIDSFVEQPIYPLPSVVCVENPNASIPTNINSEANQTSEFVEIEEYNQNSVIEIVHLQEESENGSYSSALSNLDTDQKLPVSPPPPPSLAEFENFIQQKKYKTEIEDVKTQADSKQTLKKRVYSNNRPLITITAKSLNSVKLKHVRRPSLRENFLNNEPNQVSNKPQKIISDNQRTEKYTRSEKANLITTKAKNKEENISVSDVEMNKSMTIPRIEISKNAINSVKLRHIKRSSLSLIEKDPNDKPDSVKFGTPEFESFKNKLNEKLKTPTAKILREPSFIDPKKISIKSTSINKTDIIEDSIDIEKARETMTDEINRKLNFLNTSKTVNEREKFQSSL